MITFLLDCHQIEGSHTAVRLASEIRHITDSYNITDKVSFLVSDNASNVIMVADIINDAIRNLNWNTSHATHTH